MDKNVDTEPQRKALEEMSQQLLERLNAMVAEQEQRANEFAARPHSLSSLPSGIELPKLEPLPQPQPQGLPTGSQSPHPQPAPASRPSVAPPPGARSRVEVESAAAARTPEPAPKPAAAPVRRPKKKEEEKGSSVWVTIITWAAVILILRACS